MKKLLLSLAFILSSSVATADDSIYAWGPWAEGIKPAAGPVYVAPAPVSEPQVDTRESMALQRRYNDIQPPAPISATPGTNVHVIGSSVPINTAPPSVVTEPPLPPGINLL
ncbi:MAG: hypothetical protein QG652_825 [Pseudomonadota bacterium]|nr:hypothetical protein [Pseudomonadota bacterium]